VERSVEWEEDAGRVVLLVPRFGAGRLGRLLARLVRRGPLRVRLDSLGSDVWKQLDGRPTVGELAGSLAKRHPDEDPGDLQARTSGFLIQLQRGGCVRLWTKS
jgi:hypothetical protein